MAASGAHNPAVHKKHGAVAKKLLKSFQIWKLFINFAAVERHILYYKDYFKDFFKSLSQGAQWKVLYVLDMLKTQQRLNQNFVKYIRDGIYELRAKHNGNIYRAFFIFDDGNIVLLLNGFQKKQQKTPQSEINMAVKLKNEYYAEKQS